MPKIGIGNWLSNKFGSGRDLQTAYELIDDEDNETVKQIAQKQTEFLAQSIVVFNRMEKIYVELNLLHLNVQEKQEIMDSVKFAFYKMDKEKLQKSLDALHELMQKVQKQSNYYRVGYSILLNHMPAMVRAFKEAKGTENSKDLSIYAQMQEFKKAIEGLKFGPFNKMQGKFDDNNVCHNTAIAREVLRRFGDEKLAKWLKTLPTGWGVEGKKAFVKLMEKRLEERAEETAGIEEHYEKGADMLKDFRNSLARFKKLSEIVKRESEIYNKLNLSGERHLMEFQEIHALFEEEAKIEGEGMELIGHKRMAMKDILKSVTFWDKQMARGEGASYDARIFWARHKETAFLVMDTVALLGMCFVPPLGPLLFGTAIAARRLGIAARVMKFISVGADEINLVRDIKDTAQGLWGKLVEGYKEYEPAVERAVESAVH